MIGRNTAHYTAVVFGWMTVIQASTKKEALQIAKAMARGASLLPTDVTEAHIRLSTPEDIAWYLAQGGTH